MQGDKIGYEVEHSKILEKKKKKSYSSPLLEQLGKMQKLTLGKTASGVDNLTPGDYVQ